jgi:hypothetical protein
LASAQNNPAPLRRVTQSKIAKSEAQARPELVGFARTLLEAMARKRMNNSTLARAVWGTYVNPQGFTVAKNRDRIGQYLVGASYPKPETLKRIAKALDLDPKTLEVDNLPGAGPTARARSLSPSEFNITVVAGHHGRALVQTNKLMSMARALKMLELIMEQFEEDAETEFDAGFATGQVEDQEEPQEAETRLSLTAPKPATQRKRT